MRIPARLIPRGKAVKILLGIAIAMALLLAIFAIAFDSNWLRGPLERYLAEKSGRNVTIGYLNIRMGLDFEPHVIVKNVHVDNTAWADARQPTADIGEARFSFSLPSTLRGVTIVSHLALFDADIDMEIQADGLRNWRLTNPEDRGPAKVRVQVLEPHRTRLRFADHRRQVDVATSARDAPLPAPGMPNLIEFTGTFRGIPFSGETLVASSISFLGTRQYFPLRGHARSRSARLEIDGTVANLGEVGFVDAKVRVAAPSLAALEPFAPGNLPTSHAVDFTMHLVKTEGHFEATDVVGKLGESDVSGTFSVDTKAEPHQVRARMQSAAARLEDVKSLIAHERAPAHEDKPAAPAQGASSAPDPGTAAKGAPVHGKLFPTSNLHADRWKSFDVEIDFDARKFTAASVPALQSLRLSGTLHDGVITIKPLHIGLAGGDAAGSVVLDGRAPPVAAAADIELRGVHLERFFPKLDSLVEPGPAAGHTRFAGRGDSVAAIMAHASGEAAALMDGGSISNKLDAKIGLDLGKFVSLYFRGDRAIPVNCAALAFTFSNGAGVSHLLRLDTENTRVEGAGSLNLGDETLDLRLKPQPKHPGLLALHSVIRLDGALTHPKVTLDRNGEFVPATAAAGATRSAVDALLRSHPRCADVLGTASSPAEVTAQR